MAKSKYPNQLDTSVELPAVRNSALSDSINSLRSAVIQIEKTLGVNPQGSSGNSVASRISRSLDEDGNLKSDSINTLGLISGPITDSEVSKSASISESKLNLNFPTELLQDEISMISSELESMLETVNEISIKLSAHTSNSSVNRHPATAISIAPKDSISFPLAISNIESLDIQSAFEDIHNRHINYSGDNISTTNNSHYANQIFFDNSNTLSSLNVSNVQLAIESLANENSSENNNHQDSQHSNGLLRTGKLGSVSDSTISSILNDEVSISFASSSGSSSGTTVITLIESVDISNYKLRPFDIVKIIDSTDIDGRYVGNYEISSFSESGGVVSSIEIFGLLPENSTSETKMIIGKNIERNTNSASLLGSVIEDAQLTESKIIQIANPNSVRAISRQIKASEITSANRFIDVSVDGVSLGDLDLFTTGIDRQTIDSIISRLNEQLSEKKANILCYRLDYEEGPSEIALIHNLPDREGDLKSIMVSRGSDDAIDGIGFSHLEDLEVESLYGTKYYINGTSYSGLKNKLDSEDLRFFAGSNNVGFGSSSFNFLDLGIKSGDLITFSGAANSDDNGTFQIESVTSDLIRLNSGQLPLGFQSDSGENLRAQIFSNSISLSEITFDSVGGTLGSSVIDIFMNKNRDILYSKLLEYESVVIGSSSIIDIIDLESSEDLFQNELRLSIQSNENSLTSFNINLDGGTPASISGKNKYVWIASGTRNLRVKIYIEDSEAVAGKILSDGSEFEMILTLLEQVNLETNLFLCRTTYNNFNGRVVGGTYGPRILSKVPIGNTDSKDISNNAKREMIESPRSELRYNGVIYGLDIFDSDIDSNGFYTFSLGSGIAYINGKRFNIEENLNIITDINSSNSDKFYITIDDYGNIDFGAALENNCTTPFGESDFAVIGSIEYDGVNLSEFDLRLFINHIDLKILNSITVSPQNGMGHFKDPVKALKYAKRFSDIFPNAGTPILHFKSGIHKVSVDYKYSEGSFSWNPTSTQNLELFFDRQIDLGFFIDFPIVIEGEGQGTVIELVNNSSWINTSHRLVMPINVIGSKFTSATRGHDNLSDKMFVEIKNLTLKNTPVSYIDAEVSSGISMRSGLSLKNVYFDYSEFEGNFIDGINGPRAVQLLEVSDVVTSKGNLSISDCTFINSGIYVDSVERSKNISIINNSFFGDESSASFLFQDLYTFGISSSQSNITILNNSNRSVLNPNGITGPEMVLGNDVGWGDRFSRDVIIGNDLNVSNLVSGGSLEIQGDANINGDTYSQSYKYSTTRLVRKTLTFENQIESTSGSGSALGVPIVRASFNGSGWKTLFFNDSEAGLRFCEIRLPINQGEKLVQAGIQFIDLDGTGIFGSFEAQVSSRDPFGRVSVVAPFSSAISTNEPGLTGVGFASIDISPDVIAETDKTYWLKIRRVDSVGPDYNVFSLRLIFEVDSADSAIGVV